MASADGPLLPWLGATSWIEVPVEDPARVAERLAAAHDDVVWLDSADGGVHVLGAGAARLLVHDGQATLDGVAVAGDAIDALADASAGRGPWVGWLGYEAGVRLLGLQPAPSRHPEAAWVLLETWLVVDERVGRAQLQSTLDAPVPLPAVEPAPRASLPAAAPVARDDDDAYRAAIERCMRSIRDGDSYLMCLTTAFDGEPIDEVATYLRLREAGGTHHGGLLRIAGTAMLSASPERFLRVADGRVATSPIKGTRRRGSGADDAALAEALRTSEKERAENVMIVDLCRNDLQRVCAPGSVAVTSLLAVETYPTVHQLVSTIEGALRPGARPTDALRATFPAGSMTGAPKRRTVELLLDVETGPRGVYAGCFGAVTATEAELAMVIRTIVADDLGCHLGVGGGITALSDPDEEVAEVHLKAAALVRSLVAREAQAVRASA